MKTKVQLTLLVLLISAFSIHGQKPKEKSYLEKINLRQTETYRDKLVKKEVGTDFIRAKYIECYFDKRFSNPDSIALSYLRAKSPELGISPDIRNVRIKKTQHTPGGKYVYFEQHVDNVPVFSTTGVIGLNKGDTVIYMLNNFRKINENELNTQADITGEEAQYQTGNQTGLGNIYATAFNTCTSTSKYITYYVTDDWFMTIYPNPTTGETTLTIETTSEEKSFDETAQWDMEIYSPMQALKTKKTKLKGKSTTIQTAGWPEGVYTVRVKYKDEILTGKLIVKR